MKKTPEKKSTTPTSPDPSDFKGETNNPSRNLVQCKLYQALVQSTVLGGTEPSRVAVSIETFMYKNMAILNTKNIKPSIDHSGVILKIL